MIAELGTTYKRTGFHFDKRLEKVTDTIKYFKKNKELSFVTDSTKKTHKLIIGDNYPALLNLLIEYQGAIDVIYIDPPYGKDSMGEFAQTNYENASGLFGLLHGATVHNVSFVNVNIENQSLFGYSIGYLKGQSITDGSYTNDSSMFPVCSGNTTYAGNVIIQLKCS